MSLTCIKVRSIVAGALDSAGKSTQTYEVLSLPEKIETESDASSTKALRSVLRLFEGITCNAAFLYKRNTHKVNVNTLIQQ